VIEDIIVALESIHSASGDYNSDPARVYRMYGNIFELPELPGIVVTPLHDHTARYVVLDGANRTTATRALGFEHILAQVVESDELGFETQTWNHVVWSIPPEKFLERLRALAVLDFRPSDEKKAYTAVIHRKGLAAVHLPDGRVFEIWTPPAGVVERNRHLNAIVDTYKDAGKLDRTNLQSVDPLRKLYTDLSALVFMPKLQIRHIISLVSQGHFLPAGVTRFTVSPRALRVNFPMDLLRSDRSLEAKNDELARFIKDRIAQKAVRYYSEETVLYDE